VIVTPQSKNKGYHMTISRFQQDATIIIGHVQNRFPRWEGDIIDLPDADKDAFCYHFLQHMPTWWDDVLPVSSTDQKGIIDAIYAQREKDSLLAAFLKNDIYLTLELTLRDFIQDLFDEIENVQAEPFAGYGRGE